MFLFVGRRGFRESKEEVCWVRWCFCGGGAFWGVLKKRFVGYDGFCVKEVYFGEFRSCFGCGRFRCFGCFGRISEFISKFWFLDVMVIGVSEESWFWVRWFF